MAEKLMIIDSYSLTNRAFFALPPLSTRDGQPTNAVYGLAMMLLRLLDESKPDYFIAAFDVAAPTFRHREYAEYKGQRLKMEDTLKQQLPLVRRLLEILRIPIYEAPGFEADDVIGTLAVRAAEKGISVEVVTGDRDAFQLVRPGIKVLYTRKGITEMDIIDEVYVRDRYQLSPHQLIDLKGLTGDTSDNIPGVPGFGEKTALKYLSQYQTIDGIYAHIDEVTRARDRELLNTHKEQAYLSRRLGEIVTNLDLDLKLDECCRHKDFDRKVLMDFCREYEFNTLYKKLAESGDEQETPLTTLPELSYQVQSPELMKLQSVVKQIRTEKTCYLQFLVAEGGRIFGLGLGGEKENWYFSLPVEVEPPVTIGPVFEIFADPEVTIIGHDLKKQLQLLGSDYKLPELNGPLEDIMLAGYLINAGLGGLELEELGASHLHAEVPVARNDRGKVLSIFGLPESLEREHAARVVGGRLEAMRQLRKTFTYAIETLRLTVLYHEVELPLLIVLAEMELEGIKVDPEVLQSLGKVFRERLSSLETEIYTLAGHKFNLNSPKQLGTVLFDELGLTPPKKNKTGYATDAEVLESLRDQHPMISMILDYRVSQKLLSTYIESLIGLINPSTGRVHTSFNQAVTTTGRLSSTEPNLQNIPVRTEEGKMIRRAFVPREDGYRLLAADYSQIELRVMAHFSGDEGFREAFLQGADIHRWTAAKVNGITPEEVSPTMRDQAKAVNFGIIYGISGFGLAKNIGVSRKEADAFIESYFQKYPGVKEYVEKLITEAREAGQATTLLGRIRKLPDLGSRNFTLRSFAERMARNTPIQGTAADIIKLAMVKIGEKLRERPDLGRLLLQVHDELVFETPEEKLAELARLVKSEMENAVTLSVPLIVDLKTGINWGEMARY